MEVRFGSCVIAKNDCVLPQKPFQLLSQRVGAELFQTSDESIIWHLGNFKRIISMHCNVATFPDLEIVQLPLLARLSYALLIVSHRYPYCHQYHTNLLLS